MNQKECGEKTLAEQVSETIAALIMTTPYPPGSRLPNESDMAERLGVGRSTVREALKSLATQHVVEVRHGAGTFVRDDIGVVEDPLGFRFRKDRKTLALELCEVRLIVEPEIAALAAESASQADVVAIQKLALDVALAYQTGQNHTRHDIDFHIRIAQSTGNLVARRIITILSTAITVINEVTKKRFMEATLKNHEDVALAIRDHNPAKARRAMRRHIEFNLTNITDL